MMAGGLLVVFGVLGPVVALRAVPRGGLLGVGDERHGNLLERSDERC
jgi:hypothetical protein